MVAVGDETGHEAETLREIAELLHRTVRATRALRGSLAWPAFQLAVALAVVGFLILIAGFIRDAGGGAVDVLGIGLTGVGGLLRYVVIVAGLLAAGAVALTLAVGNWRRHGFVRTVVDRVPIIGAAARAAEAAAWCRAASLASGAGLDARRLVHLSSTAAPGLWLDADAIERRLRSGATLEEALRASGRFPRRVLEAVAVGELTGNTAEVLDRLAGQCDEEARHGFEAAARVAGFLAWAAVAALIVTVIFRIFSFYVAAIQDAAGGL
jgi:type IV pilus assembly protein PilC